MTAQDNPLLRPSGLPNDVPAFDLIREEHYLPAVEEGIAIARSAIHAIRDSAAAATFENTIVALETASETLGLATGVFYNQLSAAGTDGLQALAEKIGPIQSNFTSDIVLDQKLFARVKAVYDARGTLDLNIEQRQLLEETYKDFVRGGALLDDDRKKRLRAINERMSVLGPQYNNNVKKSMEAFTLHITDEADLSGLPDGAKAAMRMEAQARDIDGWVVTLDFPSYLPFMQYADNRTLREKLWRAYGARGWGGEYDNQPLVLEIAQLRHERAVLLGYDTHAHFVLEKRMAEVPQNVHGFLDKLKTAYRPQAERELKQLEDMAREAGLSDKLQPWDVTYYSEKLKQKLFDFSSEDLRPYFPLSNVLNGMFTHFTHLFGLRFTPNTAYPVWHEDVTAYDVHDEETGRFMGTLYADFYPRKGKKDGAWMTAYRGQGLFGGEVRRPVIAIVCNFTKPTEDRPSLLTFDEVLTLFHEMGHATHGLLSDVTYQSLASPNVLWDFVELPSQVQENWVYERPTLDLFAHHYQTGEKIPQALIDKVVAAKNFMGGWAGLRQVGLGLIDMAWHTADPSAIADVAVFEDLVTRETALFPRLAGPVSTSFSHVFAGGYSSGYYSYKWAEVLDADTFEYFLEEGLYNRDIANRYKTEILSRGGSEHPRTLYQRFRGRDADPEALLRREGLL